MSFCSVHGDDRSRDMGRRRGEIEAESAEFGSELRLRVMASTGSGCDGCGMMIGRVARELLQASEDGGTAHNVGISAGRSDRFRCELGWVDIRCKARQVVGGNLLEIVCPVVYLYYFSGIPSTFRYERPRERVRRTAQSAANPCEPRLLTSIR
ncbi:hypothetical protein FIBSPDRAFT_389689 [Athelia psychrophila]|uniref:Uncharacterized protein n=1 Tax=Athelia psychrophila TaxID=1759441 RepID=A0A166NUP1_9AGAM|nr:hypothetical protein FIBSPDRAFT_389689 [Fibularhizoctonia sp. CBS 109695]